ncbi:cilia- and flagella-associated protein 97-like isoform X2 [Sinocyclocheilus rhinocerous]|uniref:Cilia- and flagella-associated protein 97 n=2 Tax=Sinocyclocheilus rhinocerous TaxID=307959 RepID=A0A673IAR6_9TELE|nr:PREDICTED: cilia- and flagella-associated protein 97-like isoform X2 [Sinocyclocheilus rhinocerous]XP_016415561.1 PREDICTED: cilia- and flagella-associated protein 97-like isoform X2 [Sinocyclocheilus rhinocerous]XP_016415562.1 PREDICTED: cilia- and flagella-associated protein 97-like isoform X2 [Sinocyclocheilus rhinocerous]XP_016415563.1 PREDICTED: cilia- and flagella-associated protein 97-like isoform X2 [Sinocyclocheilus rhinocerous]
MYSHKELEGEVDHSFFDSDSEANGLGSEDGQLNKQKVSERQDERTGKDTHVSIDQLGNEAQSKRNSEDKARLEDDSNQGRRRQSEETEYERERQSVDGFFKGSSSLPSAKTSETMNSSQSDEGSSVYSYSSDEEREPDDDFKLRKTNDNVNSDDDDDGYHRSDDESEEDARSPVTRSTKHKGLSHGTPKKSAGKLHKLSRSRSSSSDPVSSHSSEERSSFRSQKSPVKHQRVSSAHQKERQKETAESEDTVTDVTPLSTPNISPFQSLDVVLPSEPAAAVQQQPSVTEKVVANDVSDGQGSISSEGEDGPVFLKVEKQLDRVLVVSSPCSVGSRRKNYSFTNEEVQEIDRENQRLLCELSRSSAHLRSGSSARSKTSSRRSIAPPVRLYHSTLNRQREQERIQKENLAFLKRLESVKPTPGMTRDEQLTDYQRHCRYLGTPVTAIPPVKLKSSKTSGRISRPGSSPHKSRPETAKLSRTIPRPAWS